MLISRTSRQTVSVPTSRDSRMRVPNPTFMKAIILFCLAAFASVALTSCKKDAPASMTADGKTRIRVGYIGITCEAPIFSAVENGFFKEEGVEVELVKCEWSKYKDVLALGGYDITHHLIMYFLKPIEQGLDVKISAGIHTGCLRVQAPVNGKVHSVADL